MNALCTYTYTTHRLRMGQARGRRGARRRRRGDRLAVRPRRPGAPAHPRRRRRPGAGRRDCRVRASSFLQVFPSSSLGTTTDCSRGAVCLCPTTFEFAQAWGPQHAPLFRSGRMSWRTRDFFDAWPALPDVEAPAVFLLRMILHDWNDADCKRCVCLLRLPLLPTRSPLTS